MWGFPALLASLAAVCSEAVGVRDGVGTSASLAQERSDPGGLDAAASARHSTDGTRTQSPEGLLGPTEGQRQFIRDVSQHEAILLALKRR